MTEKRPTIAAYRNDECKGRRLTACGLAFVTGRKKEGLKGMGFARCFCIILLLSFHCKYSVNLSKTLVKFRGGGVLCLISSPSLPPSFRECLTIQHIYQHFAPETQTSPQKLGRECSNTDMIYEQGRKETDSNKVRGNSRVVEIRKCFIAFPTRTTSTEQLFFALKFHSAT